MKRIDKLHQMDSEQAADFIISEAWCKGFQAGHCNNKDCRECLIKYLQEETDGETN